MKTFETKAGTKLPLRELKGKDYLDVPYRVQWMREEHLDWGVETSFHTLTEKIAIAHATIRDGAGKILAQATKSETPQGFEDYIEKAETGAVGRALAFCGYGTQFAQAELTRDMDDDHGENIVDAPKEPGKKAALAAVPSQADSGPGTYVLGFGKYSTKRLDSIGGHDLDNYCRWLKKNKKPGETDSRAIVAIEAYLKTLEFGRTK